MQKIIIRECFWGAGSPKLFNWTKDGLDIKGIGIDFKKLQTNEKLHIEFEGKKHLLDCSQAIETANKYGSFQTRRGVKLAVIPAELCVEIYEG